MKEEGETGGAVDGRCEICRTHPAKYRCPGCERQTCSLDCVKSHKVEYQCSGKRQRSAQTFLPVSELTPEILLDDYWLLEEAGQSTELLGRVLPKRSKNNERNRLQKVVNRCKAMNTLLSLMPSGMERAKRNKTHLQADGNIRWTIEWILLDGTNLRDHPSLMRLDELKPHIVRSSCSNCSETETVQKGYELLDLEGKPERCTLLLRQEPDQGEFRTNVDISPTRRLWPLHSTSITWSLLLANRTVIEFPTIYIYPVIE